MADSGIYYLNGDTFLSATAVFMDEGLSILAPDGYYRFGDWVRQLLNGVLQPAEDCPSCLPPCGEDIVVPDLPQGIYYMDLSVGGTETDIGAIIIKFNPINIPDGIVVTYNGVEFNKLSSPTHGYLGSSIASGPTYIGTEYYDCGIEGNSFNLNVWEYNGSDFIQQFDEETGDPIMETILVAIGSVKLTSTATGNCVMVIPKPTDIPADISLKFIGPCGGTLFNIEVNCPAMLPSFSSSIKRTTEEYVCLTEITTTYYHAPVNGTDDMIGLYDWVFSDAYGQNKLEAGYYRYNSVVLYENITWFRVDDNGIIVEFGSC